MSYNPELLKEIPAPKVGDKTEGAIISIEEGDLQSFVPLEVISAKWKDADPLDRVIKITVETPVGHFNKIIQLPNKPDCVHPKSNLSKWKKAYGGFPSVGQKVFLLADNDGRYQFIK